MWVRLCQLKAIKIEQDAWICAKRWFEDKQERVDFWTLICIDVTLWCAPCQFWLKRCPGEPQNHLLLFNRKSCEQPWLACVQRLNIICISSLGNFSVEHDKHVREWEDGVNKHMLYHLLSVIQMWLAFDKLCFSFYRHFISVIGLLFFSLIYIIKLSCINVFDVKLLCHCFSLTGQQMEWKLAYITQTQLIKQYCIIHTYTPT